MIAYRDSAVQLLCIAAVIWLVYSPVSRAEFVHWDDPGMVSENHLLNPPTSDSIARFWSEPVNKLYTPLAFTAWAAIAAIENPNPGEKLTAAPFHLFNVALHTIAALLAYLLLLELCANTWAACAGAMLFAVHPLQVEAVAWVSGMNNLLSGVFCLAALWQYVVFSKSEKRSPIRFAAATLLYLLALFSKPTAIILPAVAAALDWWALGKPLRRSALLLIWLALGSAFAIEARLAQPPAIPVPLIWRPAVALDALAFYAVKFIAPFHLAVDYERAPRWLMAHPTAAIRGVILLIAAIALWFHPRTRWLRAPMAVAVIALVPVLGLTTFDFQNYSTVSDRYVYLPMLGAALALALALRNAKPQTFIFVAVVLAAWALLSFQQTCVWQTSATLAAEQFTIDPDSSTGHKIFGAYLSSNKDDAGAQREFLACMAALKGEGKNPDGLVYFDYANVLLRTGRVGEAKSEYELALPLLNSTQRPEALNNLGVADFQSGDLDGAKAQFRASAAMGYKEAINNLQRLGG